MIRFDLIIRLCLQFFLYKNNIFILFYKIYFQHIKVIQDYKKINLKLKKLTNFQK